MSNKCQKEDPSSKVIRGPVKQNTEWGLFFIVFTQDSHNFHPSFRHFLVQYFY